MTQCACGSHHTVVLIVWYQYEYRGYVQTVEHNYTECQDCGLEFQTATQFNNLYREKRMVEFTIDQWILDEQGEYFMDNVTITLSKEDAAILKYLLESNTVANTMEKCYLLIPLIKVLEDQLDGFSYRDTWK